MSSQWFETLQTQKEDTPASENGKGGVWASIKDQLNPVERHPTANPNVISQELEDRNGPYFILKNQEAKTYLRITPTQFRIWSLMDGENSVQDLIVEHFMSTGSFAHNMVNRLVDDLTASSMLTEKPVWVWRELRTNLEKRTLFYKISAPARFILTQKLSINNLDNFITMLYRSVGHIFFTRPMQLLYIILTISGLFAYSKVFGNPTYSFFGEGYLQGIALIWIAMIFPVVIHELGHALTVKHFGREVPKGGLMLYFGMPAAFVDTTDIWMEARKARLAVTWNGPYTGLILGGVLSLIMYFFPDFPLNSFFFKMTFYTYLTVIFNINPLLKYDGYYILSDALDINGLRERSMAFIQKNFVRRIAERKWFTREEWIFAVYGILSIIWTAYALKLISIMWNSRVRDGMKVLFGSGYSVLQRVMSIVLAAGVLSLAVLLLIALVRLFLQVIEKHNQSGGLARHNRLAWTLGLLAVVLGFGLVSFLQNWSILLGFVISAAAAFSLWQFAAAYSGSYRGKALRVLAASLFTAGIAESANILLTTSFSTYLGWLSMALLIIAGGFLIWPVARFLKPLSLFIGFVIGGAIFYLLRIAGFSIGIQAAGAVLGTLSLWNTLSLVGGARGAAVILLGVGGLLLMVSWEIQQVWEFLPVNALALTALLMLAGGAVHWAYAQLPQLSADQSNVESARTKEAVGLGVATIVRRVIAQIFFEAGWSGVHRLGSEFTAAMKDKGLKLKIDGNRFVDDEFIAHTVIELTELYQIAFNKIHEILCREFGPEMGSLTFNFGVDQLPWQNREIIFELILNRCSWSSGISEQHLDGKKRIIGFLKRVPLFVTLDEANLESIAGALKTAHAASGDILMREGDVGDKFYIIERGQVSFWQANEFGEEIHAATKGAGQFFGEVALVSDAPRNATVRAETPLLILTLTKAKFDDLIREHVPLNNRDSNIVRRSWLLRSMPIFDELESHELDWLAVSMEEQTISKEDVLFHEGDSGDRFYIVESGELAISTRLNDQEKEISRVKSGEYVGEIALLQSRPRSATITAVEDSILLSLDGEDFLDLVSGYSSLGKSVSHTSSRRLSHIERLEK